MCRPEEDGGPGSSKVTELEWSIWGVLCLYLNDSCRRVYDRYTCFPGTLSPSLPRPQSPVYLRDVVSDLIIIRNEVRDTVPDLYALNVSPGRECSGVGSLLLLLFGHTKRRGLSVPPPPTLPCTNLLSRTPRTDFISKLTTLPPSARLQSSFLQGPTLLSCVRGTPRVPSH